MIYVIIRTVKFTSLTSDKVRAELIPGGCAFVCVIKFLVSGLGHKYNIDKDCIVEQRQDILCKKARVRLDDELLCS